MKDTLVIAEAGVNHNGDLNLAFRLVEAAANAGADVVKFQTFDAKQLATAMLTKPFIRKSSPAMLNLSAICCKNCSLLKKITFS